MAGRNNEMAVVTATKKGSRRKFREMHVRKLDDGSYHSMTHFEQPPMRAGSSGPEMMGVEPMEASHDSPQDVSDHFFKMTGANRSNKTSPGPKDTSGKNDGVAADGTPPGKDPGAAEDVND
jgi:hypothetical protein